MALELVIMNQLLQAKALDWLRDFVAILGGTSVVLAALFGWLGKRYLDKRLEAERNQYAIAIENLKSSQEKHIHVYKAQFELEFKTYQDIWAVSATLMDHVARLVNLYHLTELPAGKGEKARCGNEADASFFIALATIHRNQPFIPVGISKRAVNHATACKKEIDSFFGAIHAEDGGDEDYDQSQALSEAREEVREILAQFTELADCIRGRLGSLLVIDD
jgi:hypothetical protein